MKTVIVVAVLFFNLAMMSRPAKAQNCFGGKPLPTCASFVITEIGMGQRVDTKHGSSYQWITSDIGIMVNRSERYAVGGTLYLVYTNVYDNFRLGSRMRIRRWINPDLSVNVGAGLIFMGGGSRALMPEFTGHLDLNYKDWIIPYVGIDVLRTPFAERTDGPNWTIGGRAGETPGLVGMGAAATILAISLIAFAVAG